VTTTATVAAPPALALAAEAAAAELPSLGGWTFEPVDARAGAGTLQPAGAAAVLGDIEGAGRLVLVVAGALARTVQVGPPPAEDLIEGLGAAMHAAAAAFGATLGDLKEKGADMALLPSGEEVVFGVKMLDGIEHMASLVIIGDPDAFTIEHDDVASAPAAPNLTALTAEIHGSAEGHPLEVLSDVELAVTVELGRTRMLLRDVLDLVPGSVIELDRAAGSPVDLLVNGTLIARGEVVVIDEEYGVRITEVVGPDAPKARRP
jgi:flagellar motor switch protein FliN